MTSAAIFVMGGNKSQSHIPGLVQVPLAICKEFKYVLVKYLYSLCTLPVLHAILKKTVS